MSIAKLSKTVAVLLLLALFTAGSAFAARGKKEEKKEPLFPNATRAEPKIKPSQRLSKQMTRLYDLSQEDKYDEVIKLADELIANKSAGAYEKGIAYQAKAFAYVDKDDYASAMPLLKKAIETNGLPNDTHYQLLYQLSQMQLAEEQYDEALKTLEQFMAETKTKKPEHLAMRGNALYRLERYDEAAAVLKQAIAAKNPNDKATLVNLSAIYAQADQYDKAIEVLERARKQGLLDEERDYRQLYALYLNSDGREAEGIAVINEGLQKGVLKPSAELYIALGQAYYFSDKIKESIEAYRKALPYAKDGEPALNLARVLTNEEDYAGAKTAAQEALKKGVKKPGEAWMVIGRAEFGLGNKAGLIAAYKEAAKFPETKQQATEWLKKNGSK